MHERVRTCVRAFDGNIRARLIHCLCIRFVSRNRLQWLHMWLQQSCIVSYRDTDTAYNVS